LYNYQESTSRYTDWGPWKDNPSKGDGLEREKRTLYRYRDKQWKWYKNVTESKCASVIPAGEGWSKGSSCGIITETVCAESKPTAEGWRKYDGCEFSYYETCAMYPIAVVDYYKQNNYEVGEECDPSPYCNYNPNCVETGIWWESFSEDIDPHDYSPARYGVPASVKFWYTDTPPLYTDDGYVIWHFDYTGFVTAKKSAVKWTYKRDIEQFNYTRTTKQYYSKYSSTAPYGYPNKDSKQLNYSTWSTWSITVPKTYSYREIESKEQVREREIIKEWSEDILEEYVSEEKLYSQYALTKEQIEKDPNKKLVTKTIYRYREKR
jgi:hypothetical protein